MIKKIIIFMYLFYGVFFFNTSFSQCGLYTKAIEYMYEFGVPKNVLILDETQPFDLTIDREHLLIRLYNYVSRSCAKEITYKIFSKFQTDTSKLNCGFKFINRRMSDSILYYNENHADPFIDTMSGVFKFSRLIYCKSFCVVQIIHDVRSSNQTSYLLLFQKNRNGWYFKVCLNGWGA